MFGMQSNLVQATINIGGQYSSSKVCKVYPPTYICVHPTVCLYEIPLCHCFPSLQRLRASGAFVTTSESALFELLGDAKHPKFKEVQALIKTSAPDSGLVPRL